MENDREPNHAPPATMQEERFFVFSRSGSRYEKLSNIEFENFKQIRLKQSVLHESRQSFKFKI